jgi:two-component system response regulator CpxR
MQDHSLIECAILRDNMNQALQEQKSMESKDNYRVLVVDDDIELCRMMKEYFARVGYEVESAHDGCSGLSRALGGKYDLIILDGMLPALDGLEVLRQLRRRSSIPIIMLTARTQGTDRVMGLDSGADDYLPKPFLPEELFARIRAVMRRWKGGSLAQAELYHFGPLELNVGAQSAWYGAEPLDLTGTEFQILEVLVRASGRAVSRDEISAVLYQRESSPFERSVDVHMSHLRKKLDSKGLAQIITVRGVGYVLSEGTNEQ